MAKEQRTEFENVWVEKPRPDDNMPSHVIARIIFEVSVPTILKGQQTRFKFLLHGILTEKAKPAYVVYQKTMSIGNTPTPLFQPDEQFSKMLDIVARKAVANVFESEGEMNIGTRYKVKTGGVVVRESRPGV